MSDSSALRREGGSAGCVPNRRQRWLLKAACASAELAAPAWREWRREDEIGSADPASARALPWIYARRKELSLAPADAEALESVYRFAWMRNQRLLNCAAEITRRLRTQEIDLLLLKGASLLLDAYGDEGGCYMADLDVMIRPDQVERAVAILQADGWRAPAPEMFSAKNRRWRHSAEVISPEGLECDLHWRLLRPPFDAVDEEPAWRTKREIVLRGEPAYTLSPEQMLVQIIVHGFSWEKIPPIRWVVDVHLLLRAHRLDWQTVVAESRRRGVSLSVSEALSVFDEILPGEIPREAVEAIARIETTRRQRYAHERITRSYEEASWATVCQTHLDDLQIMRRQGEVRPGVRGLLDYLQRYWQVTSVRELPLRFIQRLRERFGRKRCRD